MGQRGINPQLRALGPDDRPAFAELCSYTRAAFSDAVDLVLIHNEREVQGNQPRRVLNPMILLLAVAAWERFVADVQAVASDQWKKPGWHHKANGAAYFGSAAKILGAASGAALPDGWRVRVFSAWRGRAPQGPQLLDCSEADQAAVLSTQLSSWIDLRNKVAHRCLPQQYVSDDELPYWWSDATTHTVQAGQVRAALAELVQLTDQAIAVIAAAAEFSAPDALRLPREWFDAELPAGTRGVERPGALWGGQPLPRS